MNTIEIIQGRNNRKLWETYSDQYFSILKDVEKVHKYDGFRKSRLTLEMWELSKELKRLDSELTEYYEYCLGIYPQKNIETQICFPCKPWIFDQTINNQKRNHL